MPALERGKSTFRGLRAGPNRARRSAECICRRCRSRCCDPSIPKTNPSHYSRSGLSRRPRSQFFHVARKRPRNAKDKFAALVGCFKSFRLLPLAPLPALPPSQEADDLPGSHLNRKKQIASEGKEDGRSFEVLSKGRNFRADLAVRSNAVVNIYRTLAWLRGPVETKSYVEETATVIETPSEPTIVCSRKVISGIPYYGRCPADREAELRFPLAGNERSELDVKCSMWQRSLRSEDESLTMKARLLLAILALGVSASAFARIGETESRWTNAMAHLWRRQKTMAKADAIRSAASLLS